MIKILICMCIYYCMRLLLLYIKAHGIWTIFFLFFSFFFLFFLVNFGLFVTIFCFFYFLFLYDLSQNCNKMSHLLFDRLHYTCRPIANLWDQFFCLHVLINNFFLEIINVLVAFFISAPEKDTSSNQVSINTSEYNMLIQQFALVLNEFWTVATGGTLKWYGSLNTPKIIIK